MRWLRYRIIITLVCSVFSAAALSARGNAENNRIVLPDEFFVFPDDFPDFDLVPNGRITRKTLKRFYYHDSTDSYIYDLVRDDKLFKSTGLTVKFGRIRKIVPEKTVPVQVYNPDCYKPERVVALCNSIFGQPELSYRMLFRSKSDMMVINWIYNNSVTGYGYILIDNFNEWEQKNGKSRSPGYGLTLEHKGRIWNFFASKKEKTLKPPPQSSLSTGTEIIVIG